MKNYLLTALLLMATTSVFACKIPTEMSRKTYDSQINSCASADQELAVENERISDTAFDERRRLTVEENARLDEIAKERKEISDTFGKIARAMLDAMSDAWGTQRLKDLISLEEK
jgi:hypothetical protein